MAGTIAGYGQVRLLCKLTMYHGSGKHVGAGNAGRERLREDAQRNDL